MKHRQGGETAGEEEGASSQSEQGSEEEQAVPDMSGHALKSQTSWWSV